MMAKLCKEAESIIFYAPLFNELRAITPKPTETAETVASSAVNASLEQDAAAIIVMTTTGNSARLLSKYRPRVPILTVTRFPQVARQCHLYRGCYPFFYGKPASYRPDEVAPSPATPDQWQEDVDVRFSWAIEQGKAEGMFKTGDTVVVIQGWKGGSGNTSVMRLLQVQ
jgi:pyruvate kinase